MATTKPTTLKFTLLGNSFLVEDGWLAVALGVLSQWSGRGPVPVVGRTLVDDLGAGAFGSGRAGWPGDDDQCVGALIVGQDIDHYYCDVVTAASRVGQLH